MTTGRLVVRPAVAADAAPTWAYRSDPDVVRWITVAPTTYDDHERLFAEPDRLDRTLVVESADGGVVVGDLMLAVGDAWAQLEVGPAARGVQAEIGYCFAPAHQGRGYAREAVTALVDRCFGELGLRRVTADLFAANEPSWRLLERLGFRRESHTVRDSLHRDLGWLDAYEYAVLAEEWQGRGARSNQGPVAGQSRPSDPIGAERGEISPSSTER